MNLLAWRLLDIGHNVICSKTQVVYFKITISNTLVSTVITKKQSLDPGLWLYYVGVKGKLAANMKCDMIPCIHLTNSSWAVIQIL